MPRSRPSLPCRPGCSRFGKRLSRLLPLLLLAALALPGCSDNDAGNASAKAQAKRTVPVHVAQAERMDVPVRLTAVGAAQAFATVAVKSRVGGMITGQFVSDGALVLSGDMLFQIDPRPFAAQVAEARAGIERDQVLLRKAEDDLARYVGLRDKQVISQEQFEQTRAEADALRASIRLGEAQLEQARLDLEYAAIKAPISGRVGEILVSKGNVIKANDDRDLLVINQVSPIHVAFSVPEAHLPEIARRMAQGELAVEAAPPDSSGPAETGRLAAVDNAVDRTTGTIRLKAEFANAHGLLWPGQYVRVAMTLSTIAGAVVAPTPAVQVGASGSYVYVIGADNLAELRPVATGLEQDGLTVIAKGLETGERVVTRGQLLLTPGAAVAVSGLDRGRGKGPSEGTAAQGAAQ